jgi:hypothetical protein
MRTIAGCLFLLCIANGAAAGEPASAPLGASELGNARQHAGEAGGGRARPELFVTVPLESSTGVVFPFGGSHHAVPGVVAVNRPPYVCVAHTRPFRERAAFVTHLRMQHGLADDDIPASVVVGGGQVRYVGK